MRVLPSYLKTRVEDGEAQGPLPVVGLVGTRSQVAEVLEYVVVGHMKEGAFLGLLEMMD